MVKKKLTKRRLKEMLEALFLESNYRLKDINEKVVADNLTLKERIYENSLFCFKLDIKFCKERLEEISKLVFEYVYKAKEKEEAPVVTDLIKEQELIKDRLVYLESNTEYCEDKLKKINSFLDEIEKQKE